MTPTAWRAVRRYGPLLAAAALLVALVAGATIVGSAPPTPIPADRGIFTLTSDPPGDQQWTDPATSLSDGRVLITGGGQLAMWDPTIDRFVGGWSIPDAHLDHASALLHDGRVLVAGGRRNIPPNDALASVVIWDPATVTFANTGALSRPRAGALAATLADGRVLVVGGYDPTGDGTYLDEAEVWDPGSGRFAPFHVDTTISDRRGPDGPGRRRGVRRRVDQRRV